MEEKRNKTTKNQKRIERIVLGIYSLHIATMFVTAMLTGWNVLAVEILLVTMVAGWYIHIKEYKNYVYRAKFISVIAWIAFLVYALHAESFTSMLSTMTAVIVLLGIFCIPEIIYMGVGISTLIILYHGLIAHTITASSVNEVIRDILYFFSVYVVSFVTWVSVRTQQETSSQLMENIHDLELAEQSKDDFMVNVSHEIRTPINAVCGMSEAILQEDIPESVRRDVIDIQTAGRNLLATVSNILDFSELESSKLELAEENYNITSTITDIINMALTLENGKHLELIVDCDANLPSSLQGDEQKFRRIVMNLLDNAIKFTKEGGIILSIKGRKEEYGMNLIVSVKDSGIGIERADMEKIFISFSQVDSKRNREEGGVGLGLAISQALVRRMGGFITMNSTPGVGSEFLFTIPQKVLDETPIVSIRNKNQIYAVCYFNLDHFGYSLIREGYEELMAHGIEQLGIMMRTCRNLAELKRRMEYENYTHYFISWAEYCEDRAFFESLARETTVVLILDYGQEIQPGSNMLRIYKPFTVLSIAAVLNGQKMIQNGEQHLSLHHRFVAPDAKILVVDDNAMNLKVMARLLLPYQIKVTMAGGGQEALDKLNSMDYDCVFLDHMMPEMDGVETLHKIRNKQGSYFQSLPIIAFTANAIGGAREMFLSEGFDDFIAKPIELSVLERMLRRYIPAKKQMIVEEDEIDRVSGKVSREDISSAVSSADGDANSAANSRANSIANSRAVTEDAASGGQQSVENGKKKADASAALEALGRAGIDVQQGITYCGDEEGFRDILEIYHTEGLKRKEQLKQFFKEKDWKNYVIMVHSLKSNSKGIGANELAELALQLEMAGKENRLDYIFEHHEELLDRHDELLKRLADNAFLYPEKDEDTMSVSAKIADTDSTGDEASDSVTKSGDDVNADTIEPKQGEEIEELPKWIALLREKLDSFESEGIEEILEHLAECHDAGETLTDLVGEIREKVSEFDFMAASDLLDAWETKEGSES